MRGRIAHLSASLATLTARWGVACHVARDLKHDRFAVWRTGDEVELAHGETPESAVTAALALWPMCAYCGGGVPAESKDHAWPMCGQCPDTKLPPKWEPKGEAA